MQDLIFCNGSASLDVKLKGKKNIYLSFIYLFVSLFPHAIDRAYHVRVSLQNHACSNILKILSPKKENFQIKKDILHIYAQNIDCGYSLEPPRRGGSHEYPQSMFLSRNKKNNV